LNTIEKSSISGCNIGVAFTAGTENTRIVNSVIYQNAIGINIAAVSVQVNANLVSFDDNTVTGVNIAANIPAAFQCFGCHFENTNGGTAQYITAVPGGSEATVALYGGDMLDDVGSDATPSPQFISFGGMNLKIQGTGFWSAGRKKPQIVDVT